MVKRTYKGWTQADDAELVLMREARVPVKEIAKALKRTSSSVTNRIMSLSVPMGKQFSKQELKGFSEARARGFGGGLGKSLNGNGATKPSWWVSLMWWRK